ncbi:MAG: two-component sensor histidine kinase [Bacteroidetes bacterium]|nr:two-component sensor histidine kinase [Bacteroidota bacterium]
MKTKSRSIIILGILFGYIILQFLWWEILLVKQTGQIIELKQKLIEVSVADVSSIEKEVAELHNKKQMQVMMVVGEGTVFLLLLLFGIFKIRQAHKKELELTGMQKNFFLSITHELKTPIAATKLQLQTLQKHKLDPDQQSELISNALNETERLNSLIDNVLLASRLDSEEFTFKKEKENVSVIVEDLLQRYYKNEIRKGEIKAEIEKDLFLKLDTTAFPSIVINLMDNALKYSFKTKNIIISLKKSGESILLSVSDSGCGVADADKKKIFSKFYRAGNEETRSAKGTGLGLYIVAYLVVHCSLSGEKSQREHPCKK